MGMVNMQAFFGALVFGVLAITPVSAKPHAFSAVM